MQEGGIITSASAVSRSQWIANGSGHPAECREADLPLDQRLFGKSDRTGRPDSGAASVEAIGLSWGPKGMPCVLNDISFRIEPGEILGVVGPNGSGKSTLLRLLYRYYRPRRGKTIVGGSDIWSMSARAAARNVAAVLQEQPAPFALTVHETVALGRAPHRPPLSANGLEDQAIVDGAMDRLNLAELAHRRLGTLSGGERQRVMVARALAQQPRVLLLDEPTNHLDIRHQLEILELLKVLGVTVVCSLHDLDAALDYADSVLALSGGRTAAIGGTGDVLSTNLVSSVFAVEARLERMPGSARQRFAYSLN